MIKYKTFNVRLKKELWMFLKKEAANKETSMAGLIESCIIKLKNKAEKKVLTTSDANVQ